MYLRNFKIGWRLLTSEPIYSAVVIVGMAIGFAASFLLLGFVHYSWRYNADVPDLDNVYVVKQRFNIDPSAPWFDQAPYLLRNAAMASADVQSVTGYDPNGLLTVRIGPQLRKLKSTTVLPGFAQMLGLQVQEGDISSALEQADSLAITGHAAQQLFGTAHALGRKIEAEGKVLRVAAILRDSAANSTIPFEAIMGTNTVLLSSETRTAMLTGVGNGWGKLLIRVHPGASLSALTNLLQQAIDQSPILQANFAEAKQRLGNRKVMDISLLPLREAYFDHDIASNQITLPGERGDRKVVGGLAAIAILILALAAINYVNLATVRLLQRQREIGMRKTIGATARQVAVQFLSESMLVALLATILGLLLAWLALPLFSNLMNRNLNGEFTFANIGAALLLGALVGVLTALYPAWIAVRVRPLQVLLGRASAESMGGRQIRRVMTVLQIAVALGLTSVTAAIAWQTSFAMHASPGFDPQQILIVDLPEPVRESVKARGLISAFAQQPGIASVAIVSDAVGRSKTRYGIEMTRSDSRSAFLELKEVSANFFEQCQIKAIAGRVFDSHLDKIDDPDSVIVSATAVRTLGYASPEAALGQLLFYRSEDDKRLSRRIIGVAPDLRFVSLHDAPRPTIWTLGTNDSSLSLRIIGSLVDAEKIVERTWSEYYPDALPEIISAKEILDAAYSDDARIARLLLISTGIAIAIAVFGIYALSAYTVQRRGSEIVLRKLYGAGHRAIAVLVLREIGLLTVLAATISLPVAGVIIQRYLATYVEHAAIGYWTLLYSFLATSIVALLSASRHIFIAIRMPPALILTN